MQEPLPVGYVSANKLDVFSGTKRSNRYTGLRGGEVYTYVTPAPVIHNVVES